MRFYPSVDSVVPLYNDWLGSLCLMRMLFTSIHTQLRQHGAPEPISGNHPFHRILDHPCGVLPKLVFKCDFFDPTRVPGMPVPHLLGALVPGDPNLFRVNDHDVISGVHVRRVFGLMLASKSVCYLSGKSTQDLVGCINDVPIMMGVLGSYRDRLHWVRPCQRKKDKK